LPVSGAPRVAASVNLAGIVVVCFLCALYMPGMPKSALLPDAQAPISPAHPQSASTAQTSGVPASIRRTVAADGGRSQDRAWNQFGQFQYGAGHGRGRRCTIAFHERNGQRRRQ